ncbi:acetyl esterase [Chryseobacterium ginsenosidimutans]|uniref:alpha/beta hydrolase n=1 Tax=Chryseobacterium ginsenosidimutans TaxID=687846 RepID=UPI00277ED7CB|nr:alpha/beta hydrolase [Chryseobacterium ginsenosidimutans]MDQ0594811.1 acetyl esterase [Chryseobacterium ginsenosidimutans]
MKLSEQVQKVLTKIQNIEVPEGLRPWEAGRIFYEKFIPLAGEKEPVFKIDEKELTNDGHPVRLRIYRPTNHDRSPFIIYFHGGWFNAGNLETHDTPLCQLANLSKTVIIAVDYRLAPEHAFPAGLNDCEFAVKWIIENASFLNLDPTKITIAGDSAGAALAATVTRKFRNNIHAQLLIYPVTDNSLETPSWKEFQNGPLLDLKGGIQAWDWYLSGSADRGNPDAVPLLADDLQNLPPTFVAVAEYDPLRDEGILYAEKLKTNGISVNLKLYKGTTHGFFQMGGFIDDAKVLMQDMAEFIKNQNS